MLVLRWQRISEAVSDGRTLRCFRHTKPDDHSERSQWWVCCGYFNNLPDLDHGVYPHPPWLRAEAPPTQQKGAQRGSRRTDTNLAVWHSSIDRMSLTVRLMTDMCLCRATDYFSRGVEIQLVLAATGIYICAFFNLLYGLPETNVHRERLFPYLLARPDRVGTPDRVKNALLRRQLTHYGRTNRADETIRATQGRWGVVCVSVTDPDSPKKCLTMSANRPAAAIAEVLDIQADTFGVQDVCRSKTLERYLELMDACRSSSRQASLM